MSSQPRHLRPWRSPMVPLRTMSGSQVMQQQRSVLMMSLVHIITRDHEDVPDLGSCKGPRGAEQDGPRPHWL